MNLTTAQQTALKSDATGRANLTAFIAANDWTSVKNFYNSTANPVVNVWLTSVPVMPTLNSAIHWTDFNALTPQLQGSYMAMTQSGTINMAEKNVARGLVGIASVPTDGIFVDGSTSSLAIRAASVRPGTYLEVLFSALGAGTLGTVGAATVGNVCQNDAAGNSIFGQSIDELTAQIAISGAA